jgi:ribose 5-phosphate isomerase RpiB
MRHILKKIVKKVKKLVKMIIKEVENYMSKEVEIIETKAEVANEMIHDGEGLVRMGIMIIGAGLGIGISMIVAGFTNINNSSEDDTEVETA